MTRKQIKWIAYALIFSLIAGAAAWTYLHRATVFSYFRSADHVLIFQNEKYPETAEHIRDAIAGGESDTCTIDRKGAEARREQSLKGHPTKPGYDRDEWPMAMCKEGGAGADIRYISPKDNRGAGSWVGNQLENYPDGTKVKFVVK